MSPSARALIRAQTIIDRPFLAPEVRLHLVTEACPLWKATDADLEALGLCAPYWAFAWPGGQALARYVLDFPAQVSGKTVLSFGAGGGVEAVAAALAGASRVIASDIDPFAVEALHMNAALNDVTLEATTDDLIGHIDPAWQVVLAGDVTYESELADRLGRWFWDLKESGVAVRIADPGRGFVDPTRYDVLAAYDAPSDIDIDGSDLRPTPIFEPKTGEG